MNNQTNRRISPPIFSLRDGAVVGKLWANPKEDGGTSLSITFARTTTDRETGKLKESRSFYGTDALKVGRLAGRLYDEKLRIEQDMKKEDHTYSTPDAEAQL